MDERRERTVKELIGRVRDASFMCGEWTNDDDEPYDEVLAAADLAEKELLAYIEGLGEGK